MKWFTFEEARKYLEEANREQVIDDTLVDWYVDNKLIASGYFGHLFSKVTLEAIQGKKATMFYDEEAWELQFCGKLVLSERK